MDNKKDGPHEIQDLQTKMIKKREQDPDCDDESNGEECDTEEDDVDGLQSSRLGTKD